MQLARKIIRQEKKKKGVGVAALLDLMTCLVKPGSLPLV